MGHLFAALLLAAVPSLGTPPEALEVVLGRVAQRMHRDAQRYQGIRFTRHRRITRLEDGHWRPFREDAFAARYIGMSPPEGNPSERHPLWTQSVTVDEGRIVSDPKEEPFPFAVLDARLLERFRFSWASVPVREEGGRRLYILEFGQGTDRSGDGLAGNIIVNTRGSIAVDTADWTVREVRCQQSRPFSLFLFFGSVESYSVDVLLKTYDGVQVIERVDAKMYARLKPLSRWWHERWTYAYIDYRRE